MIRKLTYLIIAAASLLLAACGIYDDDMYGPNGEQKVKISFVLALGSSDDPFTKAETWDPEDPTDDGDDQGYDPKVLGNGFDNTILANSLQVVFYKSDIYYGKVDITGFSRKNDDEQKNEYVFEGNMWVDEDDLDKEFKMMVFANVSQDIQPSTDLMSLTFNAASAEYIPMWGVRNVSLNDLKMSGSGDPEVTIYVLRAMAKIEVKLGPAPIEDGYTLSQMTMSNFNTDGYVLPEGADKVKMTEMISLEDCLKPYDSRVDTHSVSRQDGEDGTSLVMYVPEYDNKTNSLLAAELILRLNQGESIIYEPADAIQFKVYEGGKATGSA